MVCEEWSILQYIGAATIVVVGSALAYVISVIVCDVYDMYRLFKQLKEVYTFKGLFIYCDGYNADVLVKDMQLLRDLRFHGLSIDDVSYIRMLRRSGFKVKNK